jgi:hypothetical protein
VQPSDRHRNGGKEHDEDRDPKEDAALELAIVVADRGPEAEVEDERAGQNQQTEEKEFPVLRARRPALEVTEFGEARCYGGSKRHGSLAAMNADVGERFSGAETKDDSREPGLRNAGADR